MVILLGQALSPASLSAISKVVQLPLWLLHNISNHNGNYRIYTIYSTLSTKDRDVSGVMSVLDFVIGVGATWGMGARSKWWVLPALAGVGRTTHRCASHAAATTTHRRATHAAATTTLFLCCLFRPSYYSLQKARRSRSSVK